MPFKSVAQQKWMFANKPEMAKKWAKETNFKNLPKKKEEGGFSIGGYKADSPDKDNPYNVIPSSNITMKNVPHPVLGVDSTGFQQLMLPGKDYKFRSDKVLEIPIKKQKGGNVFYKNGIPVERDGGRENDTIPSYLNYIKSIQNKNADGATLALNHIKDVRGPQVATNMAFLGKSLATSNINDIAKRSLPFEKDPQMRLLYSTINENPDLINQFDFATEWKKPGDVASKQKGGQAEINDPSMDAISKVLLWKNRDKNFVDRVIHPEGKPRLKTNTLPGHEWEGGDQYSTALMSYYTNDNGTGDVLPQVVQPKAGGPLEFLGNKAWKYAEQTGEKIVTPSWKVADYFSNRGYKNASNQMYGTKYQQGGFQRMNPTTIGTAGSAAIAPDLTGLQPSLTSPTAPINPDGPDLSYVPMFVNSVMQAFATRAANSRENNYIQSNLANPLNYIPRVDNPNGYVSQGVQQFQEGGQTDEDYEDLQDESFLFEDDGPEQTPVPIEQELAPPTPEVEEDPVIALDTTPLQEEEDDTPNEYSTDISKNFGRVMGNYGGLDNEIAAVESGGDYSAENPNSSAVGKYQFLWGKKPGQGWQDDIKRVTGVSSKEEFKNNPEAQEKFYSYYKQNNLLPAVDALSKYNRMGLSPNQLAKLVHFKGEGGARKYLTTGVDDTRKNNIPIPRYIGAR